VEDRILLVFAMEVEISLFHTAFTLALVQPSLLFNGYIWLFIEGKAARE
jgi:hypothetical protein